MDEDMDSLDIEGSCSSMFDTDLVTSLLGENPHDDNPLEHLESLEISSRSDPCDAGLGFVERPSANVNFAGVGMENCIDPSFNEYDLTDDNIPFGAVEEVVEVAAEEQVFVEDICERDLSFGEGTSADDQLLSEVEEVEEEKITAKNPRRKSKEVANSSKNTKKSVPRRYKKKLAKKALTVRIARTQKSLQQLKIGGEEVKIKKDSDSEGDMDVQVDSDDECDQELVDIAENEGLKKQREEQQFEPIRERQRAVQLRKHENCTIMHTEYGDLIMKNPMQQARPRRQSTELIWCNPFNTKHPAPYDVCISISALIAMDVHAHTSREEVMGLLGGRIVYDTRIAAHRIVLHTYVPTAAAATTTHCEMCPVSQAEAAENLNSLGEKPLGWHHSHPTFPAEPSRLDLETQRAMQEGLTPPFLSVITSQLWTENRRHSTYCCLNVRYSQRVGSEKGYKFVIRLVPDLNDSNVDEFFQRLKNNLITTDTPGSTMNPMKDKCALTELSFQHKCFTSITNHMRSCGYTEHQSLYHEVLKGVNSCLSFRKLDDD